MHWLKWSKWSVNFSWFSEFLAVHGVGARLLWAKWANCPLRALPWVWIAWELEDVEVVAWSPANQWPCYPSSGPPTKVPSSNTVNHSPLKLCFGMFWMYTTCYNKRNGASLLPWELRSPEKFYCLAAQLARAWRHNMAMRMQLKDTPTWISFLPGGRCDCLSAPKPTT